MFSTAEKSNHHSSTIQRKNSEPTFFRKAGEETFFGANEHSSFFNPAVQAKLSVSSPDDPQEKEADAMANHVMRMPDPASVSSKEEEKVQKKEDEKEEQVQTKSDNTTVQLKCAECEKEEKVHAKLFRKIQRSENISSSTADTSDTETTSDHTVDRKEISIHRSDILQRSGRGPPQSSIPFEQSLTSSKGGGSVLPSDTKQFMESRFQADFSGIRIHTGNHAESMSRQINAHAFTHGNDVYFNSGKYSPATESGATLLAHELTHTIQQGASKSNTSSSASVQTSIARKNILQRSAEGGPVPSQLTNAVAKAKSKEGKVNAHKDGADGYREGWQDLLEFFKSTFGADKIISDAGGTTEPGTVAEQDIKKQRTTTGTIVNPEQINGDRITGERDAMPSWCGIFVFWALNKSGVPQPKWQLGSRVIKPEAAYPPGYVPRTGDIAYKEGYSHYAIVESADATTVKSVNGNTAGEDNLGGQIQTREHPMSNWTGFFNPLQNMEGVLGNGEGNDTTPVRSLKDLRKKLFNVQRKADGEVSNEEHDQQIQSKANETSVLQRSSSDHVANPNLNSNPANEKIDKKENADEQEREKTTSATSGQFDISRSFDNNKQPVNEITTNNSHNNPTQNVLPNNINRKENNNNVNNTSVQRQSIMSQGRGPPRAPPLIQAVLNRKIIQRSWLGDAWDAVSGFVSEAAQWVERGLDAAKEWLLRKVRDFVSNIPGYSMLCLILGEDPITGEPRPLTGANLLNAGLDILPGGFMFRALLNRLGIFNDVALWLQGRISDLSSLALGIASRFVQFWDRLSLSDVGDPEGVMNRVANLLRSTISDIVGFVERSASTFLEMIKRVMIREIAAFVRNRAPRLFPLLTVALGFNPETMEPVQRNGTNILNALLEVSEQGREQRRQMMETGTFQRIAGWVDRGIAVFSTAYHQLIQAFRNIWSYVTIENLFHPIDTFTRIWEEFSRPIRLVGQYLLDAAIEILRVIKNALLGRLSAYARQTRGFTLICVIIGRDPFTGTPVPRTVHNLVKGFMSLMDGGEQQYEQLKESGAIDRIVNKVLAAVERLNMTPHAIIQLFIDLWNNVFTLDTLRHPIQAFQRIVATFGAPILRLIRFVIEILMIVIEAVLILMNFPFDLIQNIIAKARLAWDMIKRDPAGFFRNLLRAIKQGFIQFFDNILTHLWNGLKKWFLSEVQAAGIPIPTDFSLMGILKWLLVVLDITMEKIWKKLEERIGKEKVDKIRRVIDRVEQIANTAGEIYEFIQDVQRRGFIEVIIDKIKEKVSNAWDMVMEAAKSFIMDQIISKVTAKLLSMLDPTGIMAIVNSAIALYKAIQSFIRYLRQMLEIVNSFVEGLVEIASGNIASAANFVEGSLARGVPIAIGFLANQIGLNLSERLKDIVELVREKVDKGLTFVIDKLATIVERLVAFGRSAAQRVMGWLGFRETFKTVGGQDHTAYIRSSGNTANLIIESTPVDVVTFFNQKQTEINANTSLPPAEKNRLTGRIAHGKNLAQGLQALMNDDAQKNNPRIPPMITEIISIVREVDPGGSSVVPPAISVVKPGYSMGVKATSFSARFIHKGGTYRDQNGNMVTVAKNHPDGSEPVNGALPEAFQVLTDMRLNNRWVRFHILNADFGGAGVDSNLIPTPNYINNPEYLHQLENPVKGYYNSGLPIWLQANISYRPQYNGLFPSQYSATAGAMKYDNSQWVADTSKQVSFNKTIDMPESNSFNINQLIANPPEVSLLVNMSTVTTAMFDILRNNQPSGGYKFYRQMERAIANNILGPNAISLDDDIINSASVSDAEKRKARDYKNRLGSANWTF